MWHLSQRAPYLACFACTVVLLVQSLDLDNWGIFGPGPGLFPKIVTGSCCIIGLLLASTPHHEDRRPEYRTGRGSARSAGTADLPNLRTLSLPHDGRDGWFGSC